MTSQSHISCSTRRVFTSLQFLCHDWNLKRSADVVLSSQSPGEQLQSARKTRLTHKLTDRIRQNQTDGDKDSRTDEELLAQQFGARPITSQQLFPNSSLATQQWRQSSSISTQTDGPGGTDKLLSLEQKKEEFQVSLKFVASGSRQKFS